MLSIFNSNADTADVFFFIAVIALWLVGIVTLVQKGPWTQAVAWIATGCIPLGLMFMTP